jgi:hypothetical protein
MFDLEQAIVGWRQQMLSAGIQSPEPLEELEVHLREEIVQRMESGLDSHEAFNFSARNIGPGAVLKSEFKKIDAGNWIRPLAGTAWILFVISLMLPGYNNGYGWQCAALSASFLYSSEFWHGNFGAIYFGLLTLANLMMLASPFLLPRFSHNTHSMKWLRFTNFAALVLVWSYILSFAFSAGGENLRIGCYVWMASFASLFLSTFRIRSRKTKPQKEQHV